MGVVFEALDVARGTRVALKVLRELSPEALLRFKTEFRALQDLQHKNLVRLEELIFDGTQWFFTMERIDGVDFLCHVTAGASDELSLAHTLDDAQRTLDDGASRHGALGKGTQPVPRGVGARPGARPQARFDEARLRSALGQLAQGLAALHAASKVHRDIKPSNILVTPEGRVVLLDFGVIADVRRGRDSHVVGTPLYMAPEQAESGSVGPAADWYAVGLVLYEALTGLLPFGGAPIEALALRKRLDPVPPLGHIAGVPEDLDQLCMDLLRVDPRARPGDAEVLRRLSLGAGDPHVRSRFVGRAGELGVLEAELARVRDGESRAVLVLGESGAGKTSLIGRFVERVDPSAVVLSGRCCERESVPYKAVDEIVDDLSWYLKRVPDGEAAALLPPNAGALAQLFPVLRRVSLIDPDERVSEPEPRELRLRAFAALRALVGNIAARHPLVLVIEDLHWADADSLALLGELVAPPAPRGVLVVGTMRAPAGSPPRDAGLPLPAATQLTLVGLAPGESRELAELLLANDADRAQLAARIADESRGHPLFIHELARHTRSLGAAPAILQLDEALASRVAELAAGPRALLELVAIGSAPLSIELVAAACALPPGEIAEHVASLRATHLIRSAVATTGPAIEPYHDRVRRAAVDGLAAPAYRGLHLRLAALLEQRGADAELLAVHFGEAGETARAAACAAVAATRAASALAFARAARLFRMAVAHEPADTAEGQRLRLGLAEALANAGHATESARAFEDAARGADPATAVRLEQRAAEQHLRGGDIATGLAVMRRVLAPFGLALPKTPRRALASLLLRRLQLRLRGLHHTERAAPEISADELSQIDACYSVAEGLATVDHVRGADFGTRSLLLALRTGEPYRIARSLGLEAGYAAARGEPGRARAEHLLAVAGDIARRIDHPHALGIVDGITGMLGFLTGNWRTAHEHCERARAIVRARCVGMTWEFDTIDFFLMWALLYQGELAELARRVQIQLRDAVERGDRYAATNLRTSFTPMIRLADDDPHEARRDGAEAAREWSADGFHLQHYNFEIFVDGQISVYLGEPAIAHRRITERWPVLRASLLTVIQHLRIEAIHVRARCALAAALDARGSERADWLSSARRDARRIAREVAPWARGWVELLRAGIAAVDGDRDRAVGRLREAVRHCEDSELQMFTAAAKRRLGELVQGDEGRALIASADSWLRGQGVRDPQRWSAMLAPGFGDG